MLPRVLVVTGGFPSISQTFVLREVESMQRMGMQVHVLATSRGDAASWEQAAHFHIHPEIVSYFDFNHLLPAGSVPRARWKKWWRAADFPTNGKLWGWRRLCYFSHVYRWMQQHCFDLIHCHFVQYAAEIGQGLFQLCDIPYTVTAHDGHLPKYAQATLANIQSTAAGIACVSREWLRIWSAATGSTERLHWIPNGVELTEFIPHERSTGPVKIVSVGNCVANKRPQDLVLAVAELKRRNLPVVCEIIGGGDYEIELKRLIREQGLEGIVRLRGKQPHHEVRAALAQADIFVLCSAWESFGIAIVEGMAAGLPVIASRTAGASELIVERETGFLFEVGDVAQLTAQLQTLIDNSNLRSQLGSCGRERIARHFSWEHHMQSMMSLWTSAVPTKVHEAMIPETSAAP